MNHKRQLVISDRSTTCGWLWTALGLLTQGAIAAVALVLLASGPAAMALEPGLIQGTVNDSSGSPVYGAVVTVEDARGTRHVTATDVDGTFRISSLAPGDYSVRVSANAFSDWTAASVPASAPSESKPLVAVLEVAPQVTTVTVGVGPEEVAEEQVSEELKQRTLKVFPNYYISYEAHPAPLSPKQKARLAWKLIMDPTSILGAAAVAAVQQKHNSYRQWGQGAEGYTKRFAAASATAVQDLLITSVVADSLLHQDPRYFYKGSGTKAQRAWYAVTSAFRTKGDDGRWQPPYAGLIGAVASQELTNIYYPDPRSQLSLIGRGMAFHFGGQVAMNMVQEFVLKGLTSHRPITGPAGGGTVLRAGTPVRLIAVDGLAGDKPEQGHTVSLVLAEDLTVGGKPLARSGDIATGLVGQVAGGTLPGEASITLERTTLQAGSVSVPLRSSQVRGTGPVQYRQLPESGKIELRLFVAQDVQFPDGQ